MKSLFLLPCLCLLSGILYAQTFADPNFAAIPISSGWDQPVGAAFNSTGQQLFVWERGGKVFVCNRDGSGNYIKQTQPVLDISPEVGDWNAHGMLGFALDPNFESNGLIYVMYVVNRNHLLHFGTGQYNPNAPDGNMATIGRITRYKTITSGSDLITDYNTRFVLLGETKSTGMPILHDSHGVGSLVFAADGTLLASIGDAASYEGNDAGSYPGTYWQDALADGIIRPEENVGAFRSQLVNSMSGKILRISPQTGDGIPSNPFYDPGAPRAPKSRVWALGVRNAFRFSIKPGSGSHDPAAGDVGEIFYGDVGFSSWEELSVVTQGGQNMGWPIYEGNEYTLAPDGVGPRYVDLNVENKDEPNPLYNGGSCNQQYFLFKQLIRNANPDQDKSVYNPCNPSELIGSGNRFYHKRPSLEWSHAHKWARVPIFNGNNPDVAMIGSVESGVPGVPFPGSCAVGGVWYDGTTYPAEYKNSFFTGDYAGNPAPPVFVSAWVKRLKFDYTDHVVQVENFASDFNELVCIATNPIDGSIVTVELALSTGVKQIVYGGNQPPVAKPTADKIYGPSPLTVNFNGSGSFDPTQGGSIVSYSWDFDGATPATSNVANPGNIQFTSAPGVPKKYVVTLTVTDNGGATHLDSIIISVNNTPPIVNITSPDITTYDPGPDNINLDCIAEVTDAEHGPGQLKYEWQTTLKHNSHEHREAIKNEVNSSTTIQRIGFIGSDIYYWLVELTVTDEAGLSTTDAVEIHPNLGGAQATLNGSITLEGRPAAPNTQWQIPLVVDFYSASNLSTPAFTRNVTTTNNGSFTITNIPTGMYKVAVKNIHTLRKVSGLESFSGGQTKSMNFGTLKEGDSNNNNSVNLFDFSLMLDTYNKSTGNTGFDARCDFNGDGIVNLFDFSLLLGSYNTSGENP